VTPTPTLNFLIKGLAGRCLQHNHHRSNTRHHHRTHSQSQPARGSLSLLLRRLVRRRTGSRRIPRRRNVTRCLVESIARQAQTSARRRQRGAIAGSRRVLRRRKVTHAGACRRRRGSVGRSGWGGRLRGLGGVRSPGAQVNNGSGRRESEGLGGGTGKSASGAGPSWARGSRDGDIRGDNCAASQII
jgi:hypothetical protein